MPIYVHKCREHGRQDFFSRTIDPVPERPCQECGGPARIVVTAPARHDIERTWEDKANDWQGHGPYHQAKAQLENIRRSSLERAERDCDRPTGPITEEAIQVGAEQIDKQNKEEKAGVDTEMSNVERHRRRLRKAKARRNE